MMTSSNFAAPTTRVEATRREAGSDIALRPAPVDDWGVTWRGSHPSKLSAPPAGPAPGWGIT